MADPSLTSLWKESRVDEYSAPDLDEVEIARSLMIDELRHRAGQKLVNRWAAIGFLRSVVTIANREFVVISELSDRRDGRGFIVFTKDNGRLFIQTPHARTDLHTGRITLDLMQESGFTAGIWNQAPRRFTVGSEKRTADMGKLENSYFVAFSKAVAEVHPGAVHLQMHGFSSLKRKTDSAKTASLIVSSGSRVPEKEAYSFAVCLEKFWPGDVRLYPDNVSELGGTKNISGATLRESDAHGFIHLEIAKPLRDSLKTSATERARITDCLKSLF